MTDIDNVARSFIDYIQLQLEPRERHEPRPAEPEQNRRVADSIGDCIDKLNNLAASLAQRPNAVKENEIDTADAPSDDADERSLTNARQEVPNATDVEQRHDSKIQAPEKAPGTTEATVNEDKDEHMQPNTKSTPSKSGMESDLASPGAQRTPDGKMDGKERKFPEPSRWNNGEGSSRGDTAKKRAERGRLV